jgi:hypothetical protein
VDGSSQWIRCGRRRDDAGEGKTSSRSGGAKGGEVAPYSALERWPKRRRRWREIIGENSCEVSRAAYFGHDPLATFARTDGGEILLSRGVALWLRASGRSFCETSLAAWRSGRADAVIFGHGFTPIGHDEGGSMFLGAAK